MVLDFDLGIGIPLRRIGESISSSYEMEFFKMIKSIAIARARAQEQHFQP